MWSRSRLWRPLVLLVNQCVTSLPLPADWLLLKTTRFIRWGAVRGGYEGVTCPLNFGSAQDQVESYPTKDIVCHIERIERKEEALVCTFSYKAILGR